MSCWRKAEEIARAKADTLGPPDPEPDPDRRVNPGPSSAGTVTGPGRNALKDAALADLLTRLAFDERFGSPDELAGRYGVPKSTMSD